jgi:hypothetical protein
MNRLLTNAPSCPKYSEDVQPLPRSHARSLRGPQVVCLRRAPMTSVTRSSAVALGWLWLARLRSSRPGMPSCSNRCHHLYPVFVLIPNMRHSVTMLCSPLRRASMNLMRCSTGRVSFHGMPALVAVTPAGVTHAPGLFPHLSARYVQSPKP